MTEPRRPDARCKDCPTPSACGHYAECLRTIIQRPAGDARCKDCPGPAFGLCCRPAGDTAPLPARPIAHVHSNGEVCLERQPVSQVWPVPLYEHPAAPLPADEVLEKVEKSLSECRPLKADFLSLETWATAKRRQDEALAALRSLRGNKT